MLSRKDTINEKKKQIEELLGGQGLKVDGIWENL